jgi:hypothetical protein
LLGALLGGGGKNVPPAVPSCTAEPVDPVPRPPDVAEPPVPVPWPAVPSPPVPSVPLPFVPVPSPPVPLGAPNVHLPPLMHEHVLPVQAQSPEHVAPSSVAEPHATLSAAADSPANPNDRTMPNIPNIRMLSSPAM